MLLPFVCLFEDKKVSSGKIS